MSVNLNHTPAPLPPGVDMTAAAPPAHEGAAGGAALPPRRTPADVLADSARQFPDMPHDALIGKMGPKGLSSGQLDRLLEFRSNPPEDMVLIAFNSPGGAKLAIMPTKGVPGNDPAGYIQRQVWEGAALFDGIMAGQGPQKPDKTDVAKLMWFLQAHGSAKAAESAGGGKPMLYREGALTVEDPDRHLETFLKSANSYTRSSTHLSEFQHAPEGQPRGVDVRKVPTPNERRTVLFARMPGTAEAGGPENANMGDKNMLFIKMEEHGCRGLVSFKGTGRAGEESAGVKKSLKRLVANAKDFLGHASGLGQSIVRRGGPVINAVASKILGRETQLVDLHKANNRERIPEDVKNSYREITAQLSNLQPFTANANITGPQRDSLTITAARIGEALSRNAPLSSTGGIRVMIRNLEEAKTLYDAIPAELRSPPDFLPVGNLLDATLDLLRNHGDHRDLRIGNEVILTRADSSIGDQIPIARLNNPISGHGEVSEKSRATYLAGVRYQLADIDNANAEETFEKDAGRSNYLFTDANNVETMGNRDVNATKQEVLRLADNDARIARGLMTVAHQGFATVFMADLTADSAIRAGLFVSPGNNGGDFHIQRLPDAEGGVKTFRVGYTFNGPVCHPEFPILPTIAGREVTVDPNATTLSCEAWLNIACHPNGDMIPTFNEVPSFNYAITPAAQ